MLRRGVVEEFVGVERWREVVEEYPAARWWAIAADGGIVPPPEAP